MSADKKKIWVNGQLVEVTEEIYAAYMQGDRKIRYFETDLKVERTVLNKDGTIKEVIPSREDSLDRLTDNRDEQYADQGESVEDTVIRKLSSEALYEALNRLSPEDRKLIDALYFKDKTVRDYASELGVFPNAIHKRKVKILNLLKKFLK